METNYTESYLDKILPDLEKIQQDLDAYLDRWMFSSLQRTTLKAIAKDAPQHFRDVLISLLAERRDSMTGLANRAMFLMRANEELKRIFNNPDWNSRVREANVKIGVLMQAENPDRDQIDLLRTELLGELPLTIFASDMSSLKLVNDKLSHEHGNNFVKMVAEELFIPFDKEYGLDSFVSRIGGDEFAVLTNDTAAGRREAEKIMDSVNANLKDVKHGNFATFKNEVLNRLEVLAHIDYSSAHISEGMVAYLEICTIRKYNDSTYCNDPSAIESEENHRVTKSIIDLTANIADRRATIRKIMTKLEDLHFYIDDPDFDKIFSKKFRTDDKNQILAFLKAYAGSGSEKFLSDLPNLAQQVINIDKKREEEQRKSVDDLIDEIALRGL